MGLSPAKDVIPGAWEGLLRSSLLLQSVHPDLPWWWLWPLCPQCQWLWPHNQVAMYCRRYQDALSILSRKANMVWLT